MVHCVYYFLSRFYVFKMFYYYLNVFTSLLRWTVES